MKCWGDGTYGKLGLGGSGWLSDRDTPQLVDLGVGRTAVSVSLGDDHTCAILDDGSLKCWGDGYRGQLGVGDTQDYYTPQTVNLGAGRTAVSVSLGSGDHSCAILDNGSLKCWGDGTNGKLGLGSSSDQTEPQLVDLGLGRSAVSVSLGNQHTCAILDDGNLKCWGTGYYGQLGIGSATAHTTPQLVDLGVGRTAISVSAGHSHTCAILDDYSTKCWGSNSDGQLGINSYSNQNTPQLVDFGTYQFATHISSGDYHVCVVTNNGN